MNSKGFSLAETLIAIVVCGALLVAAIELSNFVTGFYRSANKSKTMLTSMAEIRFTLAVNKQCLANFKDKELIKPLTEIASFDKDGVNAGTLIKTGQIVQGLNVTDISFKKVILLSSTLAQADLTVSFRDESTPLDPPFLQIGRAHV